MKPATILVAFLAAVATALPTGNGTAMSVGIENLANTTAVFSSNTGPPSPVVFAPLSHKRKKHGCHIHWFYSHVKNRFCTPY
ncbi:hypothetical protein LTR08_003413 [Meristemomyces frigidus]|nr:hypothetical protein LTR08_003413 [Meristemomyces frigidus]